MKDILKKQKVKRRFLPRKILFLCGTIVAVTIVTLLLWRTEWGAEQPFWIITVQTTDASPLPLAVENTVIATAQQYLRNGKRQQLRETVAALHADPQLAAVQVIKTARDRVVVFVDLRRPALTVQVNGKTRYVSQRGDIYGSTTATGIYPVLEGVLAAEQEYEQDDGLYVLTATEQENVQLALELLQMAMQNGFICEKIVYEQYRGWQLKIDDVTALVFLGHAPFAPKLRKLRDILVTLRGKKQQAARIELDYEDKAFVQQKEQL